jgi:hypothetical protein
MSYLNYIFLFLTLVPFSFLIYTLINLKNLKIRIFHPRVLAEALLTIFFLLLTLFW